MMVNIVYLYEMYIYLFEVYSYLYKVYGYLYEVYIYLYDCLYSVLVAELKLSGKIFY